MGYYTELKLDVILNKEAPIDTIENLCNGTLHDKLYKDKFGEIPAMISVVDTPNLPIEHPFGKSHRWDQIFHGASYDTINKQLVINCDIKAYDEIYEKLFDWLFPYIISGSIKEKGEDQDEWVTIYYKTSCQS